MTSVDELRRRLLEALERRKENLPCKDFECLLRYLSEDMRNCSYRYSKDDSITTFATWIDGPCTFVAVIFALIGAQYAVRFLWRAGLNEQLTAALFSLCAVDSLLMLNVFFFYSIEAISVLMLKTNILYQHQNFTSSLHGVASSMTTSSNMLVIYVSCLRFLVVLHPLRYAHPSTPRSRIVSRQNSHKGRRGSLLDSSPCNRSSFRQSLVDLSRTKLDLKRILKPFVIPALVITLCFAVNIPIFFEFTVEKCFDVEHNAEASCIAPTLFRHTFSRYKAVLMSLTQTIGPVATILVLTLFTELRIHQSLVERRKMLTLVHFRLFECQQRSRAIILSDELKERVSRTVAIFIAVKFLIFRSMPVFFDVYETMYGIESFGVRLSIMVRVSDFMIVLNSATNSLAYFGKNRWLERQLRAHLLKKEEKRQRTCNNDLSPQMSRMPSPSLRDNSSMGGSFRANKEGSFRSYKKRASCVLLGSDCETTHENAAQV